MSAQVLTANALTGIDSALEFDATGHLPVGIHSGSLASLARLVRFNEHRRRMWLQLSSFLVEPTLKHKFSAVYVGGGYVSTKPQPTDIDLVLETSQPYGPEAFESVAPFFVTGLENIEMIYGVHLQFWMRGAPSGLTDYLTFFQYDRPHGYSHILNRSRGIVRIDLTAAGTLNRLRRYMRGENTTAVPILGAPAQPTPADEIDHLRGIKRHLAHMGVNSTKAVVLTDAQGRIEWVNECFVRTCGYTLEEARGKKPGELLQGPASDRETVQLLHRAVAGAKECECQLINYRKNGAAYVVHITLAPLFERGELIGFLAVEEDMGEPESLHASIRQVAA